MDSKREDNKKWTTSGWKGLDIDFVYAQIIYQFTTQEECFERIIINAMVDGNFSIGFDQPKNPKSLEKLFNQHDCKIDEVHKLTSAFWVEDADSKLLVKILDELHDDGSISKLLLDDLKLAISPQNSGLVKLKQERDDWVRASDINYIDPDIIKNNTTPKFPK